MKVKKIKWANRRGVWIDLVTPCEFTISPSGSQYRLKGAGHWLRVPHLKNAKEICNQIWEAEIKEAIC